MVSRQSSRRAWRPARGVRLALQAALRGSGVLAATALAASHSARDQPGADDHISHDGRQDQGRMDDVRGQTVSFVLMSLRRFAACVRKHGIPSLLDPKVVDGKVVLFPPRGLTAKSPRLKSTRLACHKLLPQGANTQPGTGTGPTATRPGG
jgi:hypothetical protein